MNKNILIIAVAVVVIALAGWLWYQKGYAPATEQETSQEQSDTTSSIQADLEALDLGDLDAEFESIDQDLNSL